MLAFAVAVILLDLFISRKSVLAVVGVIGLIAAGALNILLWNQAPQTSF